MVTTRNALEDPQRINELKVMVVAIKVQMVPHEWIDEIETV